MKCPHNPRKNSPAEIADGVLSLVPGIVLVFTASDIEEAIQDGHALVKALSRHLGQLVPDAVGVPVEDVFAERLLRQGGTPPTVSKTRSPPRSLVLLDCRMFCW